MKITIYELLGLIKDGKAPKKIRYGLNEWFYDDSAKDYFKGEDNVVSLQMTYVSNPKWLNFEVEILDDKFIKEQREYKKQLLNKLAKNYNLKVVEEVEDKEYEDIEEITYKPRKVQNTINALIRNQKYILERMKRDE